MRDSERTGHWRRAAGFARLSPGRAWGLRLGLVLGLAPAAHLLAAPPSPPTPPAVTDDDLARAATIRPVITESDLEAAARRHRMPTERELERVPAPAAPRVDGLPRPMTQKRIDLGEVARGYQAMGSPAPGGVSPDTGPALLVFVSWSMPEASLGRLVDQAARAGATLVLRGLVNGSLRETVARAQRLMGQRQVGFQIDPQAFERFAVASVPAFVLVKAGAVPATCAAGLCPSDADFVAASGDVTLGYALDFLARSAPASGATIEPFRSRLRERRP